MMDAKRSVGTKLVKVGLDMIITPILLFLLVLEDGADPESAGVIASWPAFLMWPIGILMVTAGLAGRLIRHLGTDV